ncbi:MAG TPA: FAD-dependent monooxygenase [Pseudonocardia sp.]|nr:FAD-dependent monooxygenase [Pseudonocardia sp.]
MAAYPRPRVYPASVPPTSEAAMSEAATSEALTVVVVGAGPVGLATALGLARRGVPVSVLEAGRSVSFGSRAICVSRHSLEILDRLGVGGSVTGAALAWTGGRTYYRDDEVLAFEMPTGPRAVHPPMVNISQGVLEQLLVDALDATPGAQLHWGVRVTDCRTDDDRAVLTVVTEAGERQFAAGWVVAADGAGSAVRRSLGLRLSGTSYEARYVIADIRWPVDLPAQRRVWFDPAGNPGSTIIMHRQPDDIWRVDYQLRPEEDAAAELAPERVTERIGRHLERLGHGVGWTLEWSSLYRAHARSLEEYRHGRVLFAGDAAHLVPIFGVRGLNSGLEDADTLAWQLAAVLHGTAGPALLNAYSAERRDAWRQNIEAATKSTRFMSPTGPGALLGRDAVLALAVHEPEFRPLLDPRQSTAARVRSSPITWPAGAPGSLAAQPGDPLTDQLVEVGTLGGRRSSTLAAELGGGFAVLGCAVPAGELAEAVAGMAKALAPEPVRAVPFGSGGPPAVGSVLADPEALAGVPGEVIVVRPDGLVLCRLPAAERDRLDEVAAHLARGAAPGERASGPAGAPPAAVDSPGERAWTLLSAELDEVADREAFLARLALLLGSRCDGATLRGALAAARRTG